MNVALPAFVIFIILLPGFIVRSRFKRAERTSLDYSPFGQVVTEAVLWCCICHLIWLSGTYLFTGRGFDVAALLKLISADLPGQSRASETVARDAWLVALYFGSLYFACFLLPTLARSAIIAYRLDRAGTPSGRLFRFHQAPWYYLLTGADFTKEDQPDLIAVSAIVDVAGQAFLYRGFLEEYFLNPDGTLDRLVLQQAMRRPFDKDKEKEAADWYDLSRFYLVDGDYFVLRYAEAITLNIEYIKLTPASEIDTVRETAGDGLPPPA